MHADTVLHPRWIIPVQPHAQVLEGHSLVIRDGQIAAILPTAEARTLDARAIELPSHVLLPGLVNAHTHVAMNKLRGVADDLPLMTWLSEHIWPLEGRFLADDFVHDGSRFAMGELIRGGVTCFNDMYFFPEATIRAAQDAGLRASIGLPVIDFPTPWGAGPDEYISKGLALRDEWSEHPMVSFMLAPHAPYTVSDEPLQRIRMLADQLEIGVHMHVHETAFEVMDAVQKTGERPLARLERLGLLNEKFLAVHMTQLTEDEMGLIAERGVHIAHCPESNLKLASGIAPIARLKAMGINVAIGTDGAASNNDLDLLGETRTAALLAKGFSGNAAAVPAPEALYMATLGGARALGLDDRIGSLEPGKAADLIAVDLGHIETQPLYDPIAQVIYAAGRHQVTHSWVAGRMLMNERRLLTLEEDALLANAALWNARIMEWKQA
ncbi:MAG TPA: TRZ/ATZ family hydrolase [Chromatiales bacterium]|nr:TRZ/ATZ family hydrolase [Chromatiales bacterium]